MHFIDFSLVASWVERRRADAYDHTPRKDRFDFLDFKVDVAHALINSVSPDIPHDVQPNDDQDQPSQGTKRKCVPLPTDHVRTTGAMHLPEIPEEGGFSRCRFPGCRSNKCRFRCSQCKVFLCLTTNNNCFKLFHEL